jgi:hypothetical protein
LATKESKKSPEDIIRAYRSLIGKVDASIQKDEHKIGNLPKHLDSPIRFEYAAFSDTIIITGFLPLDSLRNDDENRIHALINKTGRVTSSIIARGLEEEIFLRGCVSIVSMVDFAKARATLRQLP